jgi:hypothetical protein
MVKLKLLSFYLNPDLEWLKVFSPDLYRSLSKYFLWYGRGNQQYGIALKDREIKKSLPFPILHLSSKQSQMADFPFIIQRTNDFFELGCIAKNGIM